MPVAKHVIAIIEDFSITARKLASDAVSTVKVLDKNITEPKLADGAVILRTLDPTLQAVFTGTSKGPCRVATTANIANLLTGAPLVVDGVTLVAGNRVLVHQQTAAAESGIYEVNTPGAGANGIWARSLDADAVGELTAGVEVYIQEGTTQARSRFTLVTTGTITPGTTSQEWIPEGALVQSDAVETQVLDRSAGDFAGAATDATARTTSFDVRNFREVDLWVDLTTLGTVTMINVQVRFSGEASPDIATSTDWGLARTGLVDTVTGIDATKDYTASIPVTAIGKFALKIPVSGRFMSALVWVNVVAGSRGVVTILRRV